MAKISYTLAILAAIMSIPAPGLILFALVFWRMGAGRAARSRARHRQDLEQAARRARKAEAEFLAAMRSFR